MVIKEIEDLKVSLNLLQSAVNALDSVKTPGQMDAYQKNITELLGRAQAQASMLGNGIAPIVTGQRTNVIANGVEDYISSVLAGDDDEDKETIATSAPEAETAAIDVAITETQNAEVVEVETEAGQKTQTKKRGRKPATKTASDKK